MFAIDSGGLRKLTAKLPLLPNRLYPMGASSSPDTVFVTNVTAEAVYYLCWPYFGQHETRIERLIFDDLCQTALKTRLLDLGRWQKSTMFQGVPPPDHMVTSHGHWRNLLDGTNTLPERDITDFEPLTAVVTASPAYLAEAARLKKVPGAPREKTDIWYVCEIYGGVTGDNDGVHYYIHTTREELRELVGDSRLILTNTGPDNFTMNRTNPIALANDLPNQGYPSKNREPSAGSSDALNAALRQAAGLPPLPPAAPALPPPQQQPGRGPGNIIEFPKAAPTVAELRARLLPKALPPPAPADPEREAHCIANVEDFVREDAAAGKLRAGQTYKLGDTTCTVMGRVKTKGHWPRWCVRMVFEPPFLGRRHLMGYNGEELPNLDSLPVVK